MADPEPEPLEYRIPLPENLSPESEALTSMQPAIADEAFLPPRRNVFPTWSVWDVMAVLGFTVAAIVLFSMIALGIAHLVTSKHHVPVGDLATNPIVVIGSQLAAYPMVIVFMIALVRGKSDESFWTAIRWNWSGPAALGSVLSGIFFAAV